MAAKTPDPGLAGTAAKMHSITGVRNPEAVLAESQAFQRGHELDLNDLLENAADAAYVVDDRGMIRCWNRAAEELFGYRAAEVIGKPCAPIFKGRDSFGTPVCLANCQVIECSVRRRKVPDYEMEVVLRSGKRAWVHVSILAARERRTGRHLILHLARDIGARKVRDDLAQRFVKLAHQIVSLPDPSPAPGPVLQLTVQERKVLRCLADGKSPQAIAAELQITGHTLRNHLHHVNQKLHTRSRLEAVVQATRRGLI